MKLIRTDKPMFLLSKDDKLVGDVFDMANFIGHYVLTARYLSEPIEEDVYWNMKSGMMMWVGTYEDDCIVDYALGSMLYEPDETGEIGLIMLTAICDRVIDFHNNLLNNAESFLEERRKDICQPT